jgi:hypothetical protein
MLFLLRLLGAPWSISIAGSTFGGGSRGTAFALIVLAASPLLPIVMRWFVLIDLAFDQRQLCFLRYWVGS